MECLGPMTERVFEEHISTLLSGSGQISDGPGELLGIFVTSSSSGTLKAWNNTAGSGAVIFDTTDAITAPTFLACPVNFTIGLYITITGTLKCTVIWARAR